ncbi:PHA/PHB synthase family protein [Demetria terragena]|uniref:PHA/PHB synthase family protein n=1 Tax=Demetria terragena TaxID=63959 RepID=UPI000361C038|nr:alpha/beta fold hydrolase [Demetria terragena]
MTDQQIADQAAPLDALLVGAATGTIRRFLPNSSTTRWATALARKPHSTAARLTSLGAEFAKIAVGDSEVTPHPKDRRFADQAWEQNPLLRRLVQTYLASGKTANQLIDDANLDQDDLNRVKFFVDNVVEAMAPSNVPLVNPASAKAAIDTGGLNLLRGGGQLVRDLASAPRIPEMVDPSGYRLGENIAATPGAVVLRTDVFELIQYTPQTAKVSEVPLMIVPPTINKFYAIDLAPDRSLVEHAVRQGQQTFVLSWRNPDARHRNWDFATYVDAILEGLSTVERITGSTSTVLGGICSGGILASITAAYLAGVGQISRIKAMVLAVTVIDSSNFGTTGSLTSPKMAEQAKANSRRQGYLDGRALAEIFAWLRPGDLIWNYWVNNYLLGKRPPAFDILYWNSDTTRMTAGLHADFVDLSLENAITRPGELVVKGVPIDLSKIEVDAYIVAGIADHITPWEACYQTTQLFGGKSRFVLSTSGHIAALVNPPGNPKSTYRVAEKNPPAASEWFEVAEITKGTWWTDAATWLDKRSGKHVKAPETLGSEEFPPLVDAPGTYVFDK